MDVAVSPRRNHLLAALPDDVYQRLEPSLTAVDLPVGVTVSTGVGELDRFYFLVDGLASFLYTTRDGHTAEVAVVGREGGLGVTLVLARRAMPLEVLLQVAGSAYTLPTHIVRQEFARGGAFQRALLSFTQALMVQMAQTVVCNRHHTIPQQLSRWILLSLDRLPGETLGMTQETIARMLGVRRAGVTEAAAKLEHAGLIRHERGRIQVVDRPALEAYTCECYGVVRDTCARLYEGIE